MNCPHCGSKLSKNQKFCTNCGKSITDNKNWFQEHIISLSIIGVFLFVVTVANVVLSCNNRPKYNTQYSSSEISQDTQADDENEVKEDTEEYTEDEYEEDNYNSAPQSNNCVYKTSDGVCFTTKVFYAEPVYVKNSLYSSSWIGAKDACESKGHRLPNDYELRSLFSDILGIQINEGVDVKTTKSSHSTIPTNMEILKLIKPKYEYWFLKFGKLWENETFDDKRVYIRTKYIDFGDHVTEQLVEGYNADEVSTICVYNPNGKPYKSLLQKQKEEEERAEQKRKQEEQRRIEEEKQEVKESENALF